jgi:hypothetical protein
MRNRHAGAQSPGCVQTITCLQHTVGVNLDMSTALASRTLGGSMSRDTPTRGDLPAIPRRARTIKLRDHSRVTLRPISPQDKLLVANAFECLSDSSRCRRFGNVQALTRVPRSPRRHHGCRSGPSWLGATGLRARRSRSRPPRTWPEDSPQSFKSSVHTESRRSGRRVGGARCGRGGSRRPWTRGSLSRATSRRR